MHGWNSVPGSSPSAPRNSTDSGSTSSGSRSTGIAQSRVRAGSVGAVPTVSWARFVLVGSSPSSPCGELLSGRTAARGPTPRRFEGTTSSDSPRPRRSATRTSRSGSCGTSRTSRSGSSRPPRERTSPRSSTPATAASRPSIRKRVWQAESPARGQARAVSRRSTSSARWTPLARDSMRTPTIRIPSFPVTRRSKVAVSARRSRWPPSNGSCSSSVGHSPARGSG